MAPTANVPDDEPSPEELAAIERESGLIGAELALLDAEIRILAADDEPSALDWLRLRRAVRDVARERAELHRDDQPDETPDDATGDQAA